jgi:hypothetical protein
MLRWLAAALLAAGAATAAAQDPPAANPLKTMGWFGELAGACWSTTLPDGVTRDTQCYEVRFGRFVFGTIRIEAGARPGFQGESIFGWDEAQKRITFTFWGSNGNFGRGEAYLDGELIHFPGFDQKDPKAPPARSTWKRLDADSYRVAQEEKKGEAWTEKWAVVYRRQPK